MNHSDIKRYESIIGLPHYEPRRRRMPMEARAAQFAPFAALTGHDEAIAETARRTSAQIILSEDELKTLSLKLAYALSSAECPQLSITYFQPDSRKEGGDYVIVCGSIKKIENHCNLLTLTDGTKIPLNAIADISGDIFSVKDY